MPQVRIEPSARRALRKMHSKDPQAARRLQVLVDQIEAGETPRGSQRMTHGEKLRRILGVLPMKISDGKLRLIFVPNECIIALGYRRDVYEFIGLGWKN